MMYMYQYNCHYSNLVMKLFFSILGEVGQYD